MDRGEPRRGPRLRGRAAARPRSQRARPATRTVHRAGQGRAQELPGPAAAAQVPEEELSAKTASRVASLPTGAADPVCRIKPPARGLASGRSNSSDPSRTHSPDTCCGEAPSGNLYGRPLDLRWDAAGLGGSPDSSGSSGWAAALPLNAERITSLAKKNLPSLGTIMICSLSESRSAIIF